MVHKKYIKINGKSYGPYYYESYREGGKVKKRYIKSPPEKKEIKREIIASSAPPQFNFSRVKRLAPLILIGIILAGIFLISFYTPTGRVTLEIEKEYKPGEAITGNLNYILKSGELVPSDSVIVISLGGQKKEFTLKELVSQEIVSGDFYAEGVSLSGSGEGFGLIGEKEIFPDVNFELKIRDSGGVEDKGSGEEQKKDEEKKNDSGEDKKIEEEKQKIERSYTDEAEKVGRNAQSKISKAVSFVLERFT